MAEIERCTSCHILQISLTAHVRVPASRVLQETGNRHDPAWHRGWGTAGCGWLIRGDWEFAHTGTVPVAEEVLKGQDIVIVAMPTSDFSESFVMTRKEITQLVQLSGKKVGVLTETGQTSVATKITIEKSGATEPLRPICR